MKTIRTSTVALATAALAVTVTLAPKAEGARRARGGRVLAVQSINVDGASGVAANEVIDVTFNQAVRPSSVSPAVFRVRQENANGTGFTKQVFGDFQVLGNRVRFFPRIPTHLRDQGDPSGGFYPAGSAQDNAAENAAFKPSTRYQIEIVGRPAPTTLRSRRRNRPLRRTVLAGFTTAAAGDPSTLYRTRTFTDTPPPQLAFSNPPDQVPAVADQYTHRGGSAQIPNDLSLSLFLTRVPLAPQLLRIPGSVELTILERKGDPTVRRPIATTPFVEQNFATTLLSVEPRFPLSDVGVYMLRVSKQVKDLTEQFDFAPNRERERLRAIYDALVTSRAIAMSQGIPDPTGADLQDPPEELIPDWPAEPAARDVLKENMLLLGDTAPDEIDPRVMLLFSTRDEPVTDARLRIEFNADEGLFEPRLSTGEVDGEAAPGAAAAIMTIAAGSGVDGDFKPVQNTTLSTDDFKGGEMNFRDVVIPPGVVVSVTGSRPAQIRAINFALEGTLDASGSEGVNGSTSASSDPTEAQGGRGGPGGGDGGDANGTYSSSTSTPPAGNTGTTGVDDEGDESSLEGGAGGLGGLLATGTFYSYGGGGGGGGARTAGENGGNSSTTASWVGAGGLGGAGSSNEDLQPLIGGAGGGAGGGGGVGNQSTRTWHKSASGGGGGGGALMIQTARTLFIGTNGAVVARGGKGGRVVNGSYGSGGPGGGGGGGSTLLRSTGGFTLSNPQVAVDVSGGEGGDPTSGNNAWNYTGGAGGDGHIRVESPTGGMDIPGGTSGVFDPIGAGVPSVVYTKFADLGVPDPRVVGFTDESITTNPGSDDAILVEMQMTRESEESFGAPDIGSILPDQSTADSTITSTWVPVKVHDKTGTPGGAFPVPGWDPGVQGLEHTFDVSELNGAGYRFVRFRIRFQLGEGQRRTDPVPFVDDITMAFQFNF